MSVYLYIPFVQTTGENMIKFLVFHKGAILKFNSAFNSNSILLKLLFYSVLRFNMYPLLYFFYLFFFFFNISRISIDHYTLYNFYKNPPFHPLSIISKIFSKFSFGFTTFSLYTFVANI